MASLQQKRGQVSVFSNPEQPGRSLACAACVLIGRPWVSEHATPTISSLSRVQHERRFIRRLWCPGQVCKSAESFSSPACPLRV